MTSPRITGSWIDVVHLNRRDGIYWNRKTLAYTDDDWLTLVRHLKRDLGQELLMLQNVIAEDLTVYPSRHWPHRWDTINCSDPVGAIARACSAEGVALYFGAGPAPCASASGGGSMDNTSDETFAGLARVAEELLERYGGEASFAGWYVTSEFFVRGGAFTPDPVAFTRRLTDFWRTLTPGKPSIASPYFEGPTRWIADVDAHARAVEQTGLTAIAYQDGVGVLTARSFGVTPDPAGNARLFETLKQAHDKTSVQLWANTELFEFENGIFFQPLIPAPFDRIRTQLRAAAPFVERIVAYTVPGLMTAQTVCPGLGAPETERLYQAYRGYREGLEEER
jgi:hypothetical protein